MRCSDCLLHISAEGSPPSSDAGQCIYLLNFLCVSQLDWKMIAERLTGGRSAFPSEPGAVSIQSQGSYLGSLDLV